MSISAKEVKKLRDLTGVGMMDCKRALVETDGDFDQAIDLLRKTGQKVAAKRADRDANEGLIVSATTDDGKTAVLVEVNCETDFVARNDEFQKFATGIANKVLEELPADRVSFLASTFNGEGTVEDALVQLTGKIGEKIDVRKLAVLTSDKGSVVSYIHPGSRLGVLVDLSGEGDLGATGRDVAMQVAALNPVATKRDGVSGDVKEKEMEIAREAAIIEGKPEQIVEKIATGKLERFYKDNVLLEQPFVKDSSQTVRQMLDGASAEVSSFVRFALGE
ncbi:MAG: translation elongation factor Ts [Rhodothermia bacterium]|nr:MAG: translation elongation factor Ts [Rhodothermia bacterium]